MVSVKEWREARQLSVNLNPRSKPHRAHDGAMVRALLPAAAQEGEMPRMSEVTLPPHGRTALVRYPTAELLCYVLGGRGVVTIDGQPVALGVGDAVRVPPMAAHRFETVGASPLRVLRCCSPGCSEADAELLEPPVEKPRSTVKVPEPVPPRTVQPQPKLKLPPIREGELRALRRSLGINQSLFWERVFVTQSGGSRYESGRSVPKPIQLMLRLTYGAPREAQALLAKLRKPFDDLPRPKAAQLKAVSSGTGALALRKALKLRQCSFWAAVGITQSGGSRYESGRDFSDAMPVLLRLIFSPEPAALALLEKLRSGQLTPPSPPSSGATLWFS